MTDRVVRCRMVNRLSDPCSGEAIDPDGEVLICIRHAAAVQRTVRDAALKSRAANGK